ncbi:transcription factor bHLH52-like [Zingiber officinale]|uniref:transcription factor bHLH52-like n=1 Tax=Zingiber officinale TaxID=94328 RepID=UPI001C4C5AE4|nr:transcription factor bHLH52-like [Zingiber officinale]
MEAAVAAAFDAHSEVADALTGFLSEPSHFLLDDFLHASESSAAGIHPSFSAPSSLFAPLPLHEPSGSGLLQHWPKRHRSCDDLRHHQLPTPAREERTELSAQSRAARARRKRIAEKTQELGRLIPGGNRMTTAEMLQAAGGYVKFMQAQVGLLGLLFTGPIKNWAAPPETERKAQALVSSPRVQEKLAAEGRCVVAKELVMVMAEDKEIKSNLTIARDLNRFIESINIGLR